MRSASSFLVLGLLAALPAGAAAQRPREPFPATTPVAFGPAAGAPAAPPAPAISARLGRSVVPAAAAAHLSPLRRLLDAVGGTAVGAWVGYMASQIAWSDWREGSGRGAYRVRFALGGGALGGIAGSLLGGGGAPGAATSGLRPAPGQGPITSNDIRATGARRLSDVIRQLRPQWLNVRGVDVLPPDSLRRSPGDSARTSFGPSPYIGADPRSAPGPRIYLDDVLLGGIQDLDQIEPNTIALIEYVDPRHAMMRWGVGNNDGAIRLLSQTVPGVQP